MDSWSAFLSWTEGSALGVSVRNWGVWAYGTINLVHILGIATLFGAILVLDFRLLGWRRSTSIDAIASATLPIAITGFFVAVASGVCLLATNGSEYIGNPFLPMKFIAIALALFNALLLSRTSAWKARVTNASVSNEAIALRIYGGLSMLFWLLAMAAGRLIGYW